MRLFYSPFHRFVHKVLVVAHEAGQWEAMTAVPTFPFRNLDGEFVSGQYDMSPLTPLGKVPCLALDDGRVLYGSQTIVEYLDSLSSGVRVYPEAGMRRWDALRRLALGDTLFECAVQLSMEMWLSPEQRRRALFEWLWPKIVATLDDAEQWAGESPGFDIGAIGLLQGVSYLGDEVRQDDPLMPGFRWRDGRPALARWFDDTIRRASVRAHFNVPFTGDTSPANHRRHVEAVVAAQEHSR